MCNIIIIGRIELPEKKKDFVKCDDCGNTIDCSNGDSREEVTRIYSDGTIEKRYICSNCMDDIFK